MRHLAACKAFSGGFLVLGIKFWSKPTSVAEVCVLAYIYVKCRLSSPPLFQVFLFTLYNFAMVPARGLLFANCTMGSLTCGLGGNPHTPSHAGCRVHPMSPGVALGQRANTVLIYCASG